MMSTNDLSEEKDATFVDVPVSTGAHNQEDKAMVVSDEKKSFLPGAAPAMRTAWVRWAFWLFPLVLIFFVLLLIAHTIVSAVGMSSSWVGQVFSFILNNAAIVVSLACISVLMSIVVWLRILHVVWKNLNLYKSAFPEGTVFPSAGKAMFSMVLILSISILICVMYVINEMVYFLPYPKVSFIVGALLFLLIFSFLLLRNLSKASRLQQGLSKYFNQDLGGMTKSMVILLSGLLIMTSLLAIVDALILPLAFEYMDNNKILLKGDSAFISLLLRACINCVSGIFGGLMMRWGYRTALSNNDFNRALSDTE